MLSRSARVKDLVTKMPVSGSIVARFIPGETREQAVDTVEALVAAGLTATLDHLGEDTLDEVQAEATVQAYLDVLGVLVERGLAGKAEVSVKLSAVGQALPSRGNEIATTNARRICAAARKAGTTVTLDMEDHTTTDATLATLRELRKDYPETGAVLQAYLHRTEKDSRDLATEGSRVRLCKGAYKEPEAIAYQSRVDVDRAYVRCLAILMQGDGYPMIASHDPRMIRVAEKLAHDAGRQPGSFEFQMLYGIRPDEQRRIAAEGHTMRVYVPYGAEWYGYFMRRLAERPANLTFFLRSLITKN
jgi:proline dehydrogenase